MRDLQRARFEEKTRADRVPMRLLVALQHADRDGNTKRAMRPLVNKAAQTAAAHQAAQFVARQQAGIARRARRRRRALRAAACSASTNVGHRRPSLLPVLASAFMTASSIACGNPLQRVAALAGFSVSVW